MTDIQYHALGSFLRKKAAQATPSWPPVCLLYGEEMLYKKALQKLLSAILGDASRLVNYDAVDGLNENVPEVLARINTYSLLSPFKIVALTEARLFHSRQNLDRLWAQAAKAGQAGDMKKAARFLLDLMRVQNLSLEDLDVATPEDVLKPATRGDNLDWIGAVLAYCHQQNLVVPAAANPQHALLQAIEQGFPSGHHLMITTTLVDKRRRLYKTIRERGLVVDCSVPKGERTADRMAQAAVLDATVEEILHERDKRMAPAARRILYDLTGFDLRTVAGSVEKLADFTGERRAIEAADVREVLKRTRRDPLYALTEAVSNRDLKKALFYLQSLIGGGEFDHPLPLLAALTNQMRRLIVAKDFMTSRYGRVWRPGCSYAQFQSQVLPAIKAFDDELQSTLDDWNHALTAGPPPANGKAGGRRKTAPRSDLLLTGKGRSPYPIYKTLQKAERFQRTELMRILRRLSEADRRLKRSGTATGMLTLENVIFLICQAGEPTSTPHRHDALH